MKIIIALQLLLAPYFAHAANHEVSQPSYDQAREIASSVDIRLSGMKKWSQTFETGTDRGGSVVAYREGQKVVRIDLTIGLSNADRTDTFYYSVGKLFLIRSRKAAYPYVESSGFDFSRPKTVFKSDYYVTDHRIMPFPPSKELDREVARSLLRDAEYLLRTVEQNGRVDGQRLAN